MRLSVSSFDDPRLREVTACAFFDVDEQSPRQEWLKQTTPIRVQSLMPCANGHSAWLRFVLEGGNGTTHFHLDLEAEGAHRESASLETWSPDDVLSHFDHLRGQTLDVRFSVAFVVDFTDVPKWGMIQTLLGVGTESCGASLKLTGAEMSIDGDIFTRVRWTFDGAEKVWTSIEGVVHDQPFDEDYIHGIVELGRKGMDCFVFENSANELKEMAK